MNFYPINNTMRRHDGFNERPVIFMRNSAKQEKNDEQLSSAVPLEHHRR